MSHRSSLALPRVRALVLLLAVALIAASSAVASAFGFGAAGAADGCAPYSPLSCDQLAVDTPFAIDWSKVQGGIASGSGAGTGFTLTQPSTKGSLKADRVAVDAAAGTLSVTSTAGIAYKTPATSSNVNNLDNALGVGLRSGAGRTVLTTTLVAPPNGTGKAEQAGLWFGPTEDDYVKLALVSQSATANKVQLLRERAGAALSTDELNSAEFPVGTDVALTLTVDAAARTASASYAVGSAAPVALGTLDALPARFFDGSALDATATSAGVKALAGIHTSHRNNTATAGQVYRFRGFSVTQPDTTPPAVPANLTSTATANAVTLGWEPVADADLAGYQVFRGTSEPVATTGTPLSGTAPIAEPRFTDDSVLVGQSYSYVVRAVDTAGNVSAATPPTTVTPPAPAGEVVAKVNFQKAGTPVPAGYTADTGAAYDSATGQGWVAADGTPLDLTKNARTRGRAGIDPRLDSFVHMQYGDIVGANPDTGVSTPGSWELAVPNGTYSVLATVGDQPGGSGYDSRHTIRAEGQPVITSFQATAAREYEQASATVEVRDGRLTLDAVGGNNTKIDAVEVRAVEVQDTTAPAAPQGLTSALASGGVQLSWTANTEADLAGYDVYRSTSGAVDPSGAPLNTAPLTEPSFLDTTVEPGTSYTYAITAKDTAGNTSPLSATTSTTTPPTADTTAPAAPTGVTATPAADGSSVRLAWTAGTETDLAGYRVYRGDSAPVATTGTPLSGAALLSSPSYTDASVSAGSSYAYVVIAVDEAGNASPASDPATADVPSQDVVCSEAQYRAEYFRGTTLSGEPVTVRCESSVGGDYGDGAPQGVDVDPDSFSGRWSQRRQLAAGTYSFTATADDGVRVLVDGRAVIDEFQPQGPTTFTARTALTAGVHDIVVEYNELGGGAVLRASYAVVDAGTDPAPVCTAGQWSAQYYDGTTLSGGLAAQRCEDAIDYDFGSGGPAGVDSVGADTFSVRWTSTRTLAAGDYDLRATADDGIRVTVDGATVIDAFVDQGPTTYTKSLPLSAGDHTIVVEYYEQSGGALARFGITRASDTTTCAPDQYRAEYFTGTTPDGTPVAVRCEDAIDNDYGDGGPAGVPVGSDNFSVRWTRTSTYAAGTYSYVATADDGVRVSVDGTPVLDGFRDQGPTRYTGQRSLSAGEHTVVVEYYERSGGALVRVQEQKVQTSVSCSGGEYRAEYFNSTDLTGTPVDVRCEGPIDNDYGNGSPSGIQGLGNDDFSIRWTTTATLDAGTYAFTATADDGVRVLVDGEAVIDEFRDQGPTTFTADRALTRGDHTITVEYYERSGGALVRFGYTRSSADTTPPPAPAQPTALASDGQVQLSWPAVQADDLAGYRVYRGTGETVAAQGAPLSGSQLLATPAYTDTAVVNGTTYRYVVVAVDTAGNASAASPSVTATPAAPAPFTAALNFQPDAAPVPAGFTKQTGTAYSEAGGSGWVRQDSLAGTPVPLDLTKNTRDRNRTGVAQELDTIIHMQYGDIVDANPATGTGTAGAFELAVPNGTYAVAVSAGDAPGGAKPGCAAPCYDSTHTVRAEGVTVLSFAPGANEEYRSGSADVVVSDGLLTIDAVGGTNTKLNWLRVDRTVPDTEAPAAPASLTATPGDSSVALRWPASTSADTAGYRLYRSTGSSVTATGAPLSGADLLTSLSYLDSTAVNGTAYRYAVVAVDRTGNVSPASPEATATPAAATRLAVSVNFSDAATEPPVGDVRDFGEAYSARSGAFQGSGLSYGWVVPGSSTPLSLVGNGRVRTGTLPLRQRTLVHMQYNDVDGTNGVKAPGAWELAVPDGLYRVTATLGDDASTTAGYDSAHALNVEGAVAVERYVGTDNEPRRTASVTVDVQDGRLTLDAVGGTNTKIDAVDVQGVADAPVVTSVLPANRSTGADVSGGVSANIEVPGAGVGVDPTTLAGNVKLFAVATGAEVPSTSGSSGGNDVIALAPNDPLTPSTAYRFVVTDRVRSEDGKPFVPFTSVFTSGDGVVVAPSSFTPVKNVSFERVEQTVGRGKYIASMTFGPDGKMYASTIGQGIYRYDVDADGNLGNEQLLGFQGRAVIGMVFDKAATAANPILWITHSTANTENEQSEWASKVTRLSGPDLATKQDVFIGLPRSLKDHLTNSIAYGPDGRLYFLQGSNQAAGDPDSSWGTRGEKLLTAAVLRFDPKDPKVQAALDGGRPIDVQTSGGGSYDPFAPGAPLEIYATGVRNAYDLVWHSNGHLYVPTNGTAGGGNSPGVTKNADGTYTRTGQTPGVDLTQACAKRIDGKPYSGPSVPAVANHPTQRDFLYDVQQGGYYGHPNPLRCEFVLHNGGNAEGAGQGGSKYAASVAPDPNFRGWAYDFEFNKSPDGAIEYKGGAFGGQLDGRLVVVRFSNNNDLIFLQPDRATGKILGAQTETGFTGQPDTQIGGVGGFKDPLEVVEDPRTGNLYVNQYDRGGSGQTLYLLKVPAAQQASALSTSKNELVFSAANRGKSGDALIDDPVNVPQAVTVTNNGASAVSLTTALSGANAGQFRVSGAGGSLAPGASRELAVSFAPAGVNGPLTATLTVSGGAGARAAVPLYGLAAVGLEGSREPTLKQALSTLGFALDNGWSTLADGTAPTAKGDEVLTPLFERAGPGPVTMTPVAAYAPQESLPFGWYTEQGTRTEVGALASGQLQRLNPQLARGGASFDPGSSSFGLWYQSNTFNRIGWTEDARNAGNTHRARVYPLKDRAGAKVSDAFLVAFEDADNGDYQDYVFVVRGLRAKGATPPVDPPPSSGTALKVNFGNAAAPLPAGYVRDFGQGFGARTAGDQGSGRSYGWLDQATENPLDLSVGGTTPGNGRTRKLAADPRLDTLMHMRAGDLVPPATPGGSFNGTAVNAYWELAVPNGSYSVTVAVGDASVGTDPESHTVNAENAPFISGFVPSGPAGSATRHTTATKVVQVSDGRLTLDANGGTNTKIDYVDVEPVATTPAPADAQVSFRPASAPVPTGWTADTGLGYTAARGYGWVVPGTGNALDRSDSMRLRTGPADQLLRSFSILQNDAVATLKNGSWEYAVPNGRYTVQVSVGDNDYFDSTHSVQAEGVNLISKYVPSAAGDFETGAAEVVVNDGRLTVSAGDFGKNTKINWVRITKVDGANDTTKPTVTLTASGDKDPEGRYLNSASVAVAASDLGGSNLESVTVAVDGGAPVAYSAPVQLAGAGEHTVLATAKDGAGNTTTSSLTVTVVAFAKTDGVLTLSNPESVPFDDRLVMSRIQSTVSSPSSKDTARLVLKNTGTAPLTVSSLKASGTAFAVTAPTSLPVTVPAGGSANVDVAFTAEIATNQPQNRLYAETLTVFTNARNGGSTPVELAGIWQKQSEGGNEPDVAEISRAFGYGTTILKPGQQLNNKGVVTKIGDEVLSPYWGRLDRTQPVQVRQLAAYHSCCENTASFFWHPKGSSTTTNVLTHNGAWAQTLLPRKNGSSTAAAATSFSPSSTLFGFKIDPEWSDPNRNNKSVDSCPGQPQGQETDTCKLGHHMRFWPAKDRAGVAIPGTYLVVMDYAGINYDFNDNVYLLTNVVPESDVDTTAPAAPTGLTAARSSGAVSLDWADNAEPDLASYRVERAATDAGPWTVLAPTAVTSSDFLDSSAPASAVVYRVTATDRSGNTSAPSATAGVGAAPQAATAVRINAGGPAVTTGGIAYSADTSFAGGKTYSNPQVTEIAGTTDDVLYRTERSSTANLGSFGYRIPVSNGTYTVRLHFAEIYHGAPGGGPGGAGKRVLSANLEGGPVELQGYDIFAAVGAVTADVRSFTVSVTDGVLDIDFAATVNQPKVSAIEVLST